MTLLRPTFERVTAASFCGSPNSVVVGFADGRLEYVQLGGAPWARRLPGLDEAVEWIATSADGTLLVAAGRARGGVVVDVAARAVVRRLPDDTMFADGAIDARGAVAVAGTGGVRRWAHDRPLDALPPPWLDVPGSCDRVALDDAGGLVLTCGFAWLHWPHGAATPRTVVPSDLDPGALAHNVGRVVPVPGGRRVVVYWDDVRVFDAATGAIEVQLARPRALGDVRLARHADVLAVGSIYGNLLVQDLHGVPIFDREVTPDEIVGVSLSDAGDRVAFVDLNGGFAVLDPRARRSTLSHTWLMELVDAATS